MPVPKPKTRQIFFTADAKLNLSVTTRPKKGATFAAGAAPDPADLESIATLSGYPIVWNAVSDDRGGYFVRLLPNSAAFCDPTQAYWHHDAAVVLGNTQNASLRITPDDVGVRVEIDLPDTTDGNNAQVLVGKKYVNGMSFAMTEAPIGDMVTEAGRNILNVRSFTCDEVTITGIPSFTQTTIEVAGEESDPDYAKSNAAEQLRFEKLRFEFLTLK